jgi:hypothetical protein
MLKLLIIVFAYNILSMLLHTTDLALQYIATGVVPSLLTVNSAHLQTSAGAKT